MNRKKFKQVVAKTVRDDDIDYVTSSEEDEVNEPLDFEPNDELLPKPYRPNDGFGGAVNALPRDENPVVFLEIAASGGKRMAGTGEKSQARVLGRLHFELRQDMCPVTCANFLALVTGQMGVGLDGVLYHYKGCRLHRVSQTTFQSGDLLDQRGNCSRSIYNKGALFRDENFVLRHTGPGCLSMCNRGADSNGSIFQVCFSEAPELDNAYVVIGSIVTKECFKTLDAISRFSSQTGVPTEDLFITDCGIAYPDPNRYFDKMKALGERQARGVRK